MGSLLYQSREKAVLFEKLPHGWRSLGQAPPNVRHAALALDRDGRGVGAIRGRPHGRLYHAREGHPNTSGSRRSSSTAMSSPDPPAGARGRSARRRRTVYGWGFVVTQVGQQRNVASTSPAGQGPSTARGIAPIRAIAVRKNYMKIPGEHRNEPMPVAVFIGRRSLYYAAAATTAATGPTSSIAAALAGPVRLVNAGPST